MTKVAAATSKSAQELLRYQQNNGYLNDVRLESFGFFLDNYVIYGGDLTFDTVDAYKLLLSEGIISLNDQLWRAFIKEFRINKYNTTYYVGFLHEKGYVIGETEPAENYMRLWTIPVDANGVIGVPIDHRNMYGYLKFKAKYDGVYLNVDEVQQAITNANSAADRANEAASDVQGAVDEAKRAANQANEAVVKTEAVLESVSSSLSQLDKSIEDADKAIGESNTATASAKQAAQDAITAKDNLSNSVDEKIIQADSAIRNANDAAGVANQASEAIKGWNNKRQWNKEQNYEKNNIVTYNGSTWQALRPNKGVVPVEGEDWTCLAQKGVDGKGAVSSVNGNFPDENGNVELDIQQGTVQKVNGKSPDDKGEVTLVASDLGEMPGDQLTDESVSLAKLAHDVQDAIKKAGGNSFFIPYPLSTTMENQKTWDLPANSYDAATDSLLVFHNRGILDKESWTITGDPSTGYTLVIPENPIIKIEENNVIIIVLKNAPSVVPESFSGTLLTPGSVGLEKLGQDVQDAINNAGGKIVIVNDFTTGGADKAASAETVKVLKNQVDGNREVITNLEQTVSQNQEAVTESVGNLQQTVTNNQQVVTEHLAEMKPKVENSWQKGIENDATVTNLSPYVASKVVYFSEWDVDNSKLDALFINIPTTTFSGMIKLSLVGNYGVGNSMGGAEVIYQVGKVNSTVYSNSKDILTISSSFANTFYIGNAVYLDNRFYIPVTKAPKTRNVLSIKVEVHSINSDAFNIANSISVNRAADVAQPHPWTPQTASFVSVAGGTMTGNLIIDKTIPGITLKPKLNTPDVSKTLDFYYNAAGENNFGAVIEMDRKPTIQILNQKDVRFFGHDDAWFTIQDLKSSVSDGKTLVASAISDMGVYTSPVETFPNMANNIRLISGKKAKGRVTVTSNRPGYVASYLRIANLGFAPTTVVAKKVGDNSNRRSSAVNADYFDASLGAIKMYASDSDVVYTGNSGWDGSVFWLQVDSPNGTEYEWRAYGE